MSNIIVCRKSGYRGSALLKVVQDREVLQKCVIEFVGAEIPRCMTEPTIIRKVRSWLNVSARHHVTRIELFNWLHYVYEQAAGTEVNFDYSMCYTLFPGGSELHVKTEWGGWAHKHWLDCSYLSEWKVTDHFDVDWDDSAKTLVVPIMTPGIFKGLEEKCV